MAQLTLNNRFRESATYVPNEFIDTYMTEADGEYVKIYLYLLRCMNRQEEELSISRIADHFDHTEKDIHRALKYWEKVNLLRLEYDSTHRLSGICLLPGQDTNPETPACSDASGGMPSSPETFSSDPAPQPAPEVCPAGSADLGSFCRKEEIRELIFLAETYLNRTISQTDLAFLFSWYDQLHFSPELIEYLIESCVANNHPSLHYMQKVAEDWSAKGIRTPAQAKQMSTQHSSLYFAVMKAFGIRGRNLVPAEESFLEKWTGSYGFSAEIICEACRRTIQKIHEPSFEYADTILKNWHAAGVRTLKDVEEADAAYRKSRNLAASKPKSDAARPNKFTAFGQREYDYDLLTRALLEKSIQ